VNTKKEHDGQTKSSGFTCVQEEIRKTREQRKKVDVPHSESINAIQLAQLKGAALDTPESPKFRFSASLCECVCVYACDVKDERRPLYRGIIVQRRSAVFFWGGGLMNLKRRQARERQRQRIYR
jgi:hypothetical protein